MYIFRMEYLSDGRPCKACTSAEDMIRIGQNIKKKKDNKEKNNLNEKTNKSSSHIESREEMPPRKNCPVDKDELGRSTWNLLHTITTYYPEKPTISDKENMNSFLTSLSKVFFLFCIHFYSSNLLDFLFYIFEIFNL